MENIYDTLGLRYIEFAMHRVQYAVFLQILLVKKN